MALVNTAAAVVNLNENRKRILLLTLLAFVALA